MIGDKIRELRERRAWTQAHLADASGVSLRTVQRLETVHSCSHETLLALASALEVNISELTCVDDRVQSGPLLGSSWIGLAAMMTAPAVLFVSFNLLKYSGVWALPYDIAASTNVPRGIARAIDSPLVLMGAPILALLLAVAAQVRPLGKWSGGSGELTGVELYPKATAILIGLAAMACVAVLAVYLVVENLVWRS